VGDPCQNSVSFSPDSRLVVTGGADGVLRIWNFPEMQMRSSINASKKEISDIDISPDRKLVSEQA
jgi:WD40 repeat protein